VKGMIATPHHVDIGIWVEWNHFAPVSSQERSDKELDDIIIKFIKLVD
jgi:hypothetical protein